MLLHDDERRARLPSLWRAVVRFSVVVGGNGGVGGERDRKGNWNIISQRGIRRRTNEHLLLVFAVEPRRPNNTPDLYNNNKHNNVVGWLDMCRRCAFAAVAVFVEIANTN